jgi:hypothetical protein
MDFNSVVHQATRMLIEWTPSNNAETLSYRMLQLVRRLFGKNKLSRQYQSFIRNLWFTKRGRESFTKRRKDGEIWIA